MRISVVIPTHNEMNSVGDVVRTCKLYCDEILVVDDGSTDNSSRMAEMAGAKIIRNGRKLGVVKSLEVGVKAASGDIIVTLDADGQHDPSDIPNLVQPIISGDADLVLGKRNESPISEQLIGRMVRSIVKCDDVGTGYRAFELSLAQRIQFWGLCTCGSLVLEAHRNGARIVEVPVRIRPRRFGKSNWSPSSRTTTHLKQATLVVYNLVKWRCESIIEKLQT